MDETFTDGYGQVMNRKTACRNTAASIVIMVTDTCPCNYPANAYSNKRWCVRDCGLCLPAAHSCDAGLRDQLCSHRVSSLGSFLPHLACSCTATRLSNSEIRAFRERLGRVLP